MMGQYTDSGTRAEGTWTELLSEDLAEAYALYVNEQGFTADGEPLTLEPSEEGVYAQGSYYDYVLGVVQQSLNDFLAWVGKTSG